jgi:ketosteroid isomerase-like protein
MTPNRNEDSLQAVVEAERRLAAAHLNKDLKTIDYLLHPDYVILQPGGLVETKAQVLESFRNVDRYWDSAEVDDLDVRIYGDTAVVLGLWRAKGRHGEAYFDYSARFLSIWIRDAGRWQNIAYQSTKIDSQAVVK